MGKRYRVEFIEVGRSRKNWSLDVDRLGYSELYASIKKNRALGSKGIDFEIDADTMAGNIYAGMRSVGQIRITERPK